jgi:hypothetical protein
MNEEALDVSCFVSGATEKENEEIIPIVDRDSSVGTATRYRPDGPGTESRWGRDFPHVSRPVLWPTQPPIEWVPGLSWR